ncbi:helix-turn-helix domain-containing protein [Paracoccus zhejiangensis]|uniref:HTH cro/C1-type domain-containing protein n=1 Tax=Paracoccus zhejiangensis TaxID=1077935 RepID=A0A2H5F1T5_9RHOB|nr:helix-turn-helix transcriptional regulator [Paracoccus zhejiangensis]AUH65511.1 hypothetical protein CX676_16210 [Paracoccus zhejiangensis]
MLGQRIQIARQSLDMEIAEFASALGMDGNAASLARWEADEASPTLRELTAIGSLAGISLCFFLPPLVRDIKVQRYFGDDVDSLAIRARALVATYIAVENYISAEFLATGTITPPSRMDLCDPKHQTATGMADMIRHRLGIGSRSFRSLSDELELNGLKIFAARLPARITGISCDICLGDDPAHPFFVASSIASHRETQENLFDWAFSEGISAICGDSAELHSEIRTTFLRSCFPISKPSEILTLRHTKKGGHTDRYTSAIYRKVRGGTASGRLSKSDAERIEKILRSSEA